MELTTRQKNSVQIEHVLQNLVEVDFNSDLLPSETPTRGHQFKFRQLQTRINSFQHSFLPATIRDWNSLPADVVTSASLDNFTDKLNNLYMHTHTLIYEVQCTINKYTHCVVSAYTVTVIHLHEYQETIEK